MDDLEYLALNEVAERLIRTHADGDMNDDELHELGIAHDPNGELVVAKEGE